MGYPRMSTPKMDAYEGLNAIHVLGRVWYLAEIDRSKTSAVTRVWKGDGHPPKDPVDPTKVTLKSLTKTVNCRPDPSHSLQKIRIRAITKAVPKRYLPILACHQEKEVRTAALARLAGG